MVSLLQIQCDSVCQTYYSGIFVLPEKKSHQMLQIMFCGSTFGVDVFSYYSEYYFCDDPSFGLEDCSLFLYC